MSAHFTIYHHADPPAYYDVVIERDHEVSMFRIANYDILDFLDGNEIQAEGIDPRGAAEEMPGMATGHGKGLRLFDGGPCVIERWVPPVCIVQVETQQFNGTLHILKVEEGFSLRYVRSRVKKPPRR